MESGLEDRNNNSPARQEYTQVGPVSMESGLEDRNNGAECLYCKRAYLVSMESGLEDRNNCWFGCRDSMPNRGLNGVRPRRPEQ